MQVMVRRVWLGARLRARVYRPTRGVWTWLCLAGGLTSKGGITNSAASASEM